MQLTASQPAVTTETEAPDEQLDLEASVDGVIALCDGDMRTAIRSLIVANGYLEAEAEGLREVVSVGYVRGLIRDASALGRLWRGC